MDQSDAIRESDVASESADDPTDPTESLPEPVEWGPVGYDRLRSLFAGFGLVILLAVTLIAGLVAVGVVRAALAGSLALGNAWIFAVLLLVGGPLSIVYLLVGFDRSTAAGRRSLWKGLDAYSLSPERFRPGWVLAGVATLGVVWRFGPSELAGGLWLLFPAIWFVPAFAGYRGATVRLDPVERTVERSIVSTDRTRRDDLDAVVRTRRIDLPWTTLFLLAFRGNAWYRSTPWLFVPTDRADEVERALDAALARSDGPDRASVPERVTLALIGGSSLFVGLAMAVVGGESGGWVLTIVATPVSLLLLALAARL